ncbi:MAG TPA: hypothetical protein VEL07_07805 [Planctomycetota bacterium]|nr:hypothetical protein [Planctomycetota bacterium]
MRPSILIVGGEGGPSIARDPVLAEAVDIVDVPSTAAAALALLAGSPPRLAAVVVGEDPLAGPVAGFIDWTMRLWPHLPVVVACAQGSPLRWLHRPNLHRVAPGDAEHLARLVTGLLDDQRALVAH